MVNLNDIIYEYSMVHSVYLRVMVVSHHKQRDSQRPNIYFKTISLGCISVLIQSKYININDNLWGHEVWCPHQRSGAILFAYTHFNSQPCVCMCVCGVCGVCVVCGVCDMNGYVCQRSGGPLGGFVM